VWLDTDRHRTGLLAPVMAAGSSYRDYAEWALDVPMYFFKRDGAIVANTGQPFRSFWQQGYMGHHATQADWELHLNTLFPEVRLQRTLEFRSVDSLPRRWFAALPAFWAGLLYDEVALAAAEQLVEPLEHDALEAVRPAIAARGLGAELAGETVRHWALRALEVSLEGLSRRGRLDVNGHSESVHLEPIAELTARGLSPADLLIEGLDPDAADLREQILERCDARR
jgi:glutamate--cysteine ligase